MRGKTIFFDRLKEEFFYQLKVLRTVFDWSVILYMVVPFVVILPLFYWDLWQNPQLYWHENIPFIFLLVILLFVSMLGNFRTFVYDADILFLLRKKSLFYSLKSWAFFYSVCRGILGTALLIGLVLPILVLVYDFSFINISFLLLFIIAYQLVQLTIKKVNLHHLWQKILHVLIISCFAYLYINLNEYLLFLMNLLMIGAFCYAQLIMFVQSKRHFIYELNIEKKERVRHIQWILMASNEVEKLPTRKFRKPLLFFPSKRIFRKQEKRQQNGLLELLLKAFFRNGVLLNGYLFLISLFVLVIFFVPFWLKWFGFVIFSLLINSLTKSIYNRLLNEPFFNVVPYKEANYTIVWKSFRKWVGLPTIIFLFCITVVLSFSAFL